MILKAALFIDAVYCMGTHGHPFTYYLLVLLSDEEKTPEHEVANKIEEHCRYLGLVFVLAHKSASAREGRAKGKLFWNNTLENAECVYKKPGFEIEVYKKIGNKERLTLAKNSWKRWGTKATDFMVGAETYLDDENYRIAVFMLHQVAESKRINSEPVQFFIIQNYTIVKRVSFHKLYANITYLSQFNRRLF